MKNILVPRNLEGRKEKIRKQNIQLLSKEVIKGYLIIDKTFEGIDEELVKVKEIYGYVLLRLFKGYIPSWLKDVKIHGWFDCSYNNLNTLENCPQYIGSSFNCSYNELTSLDGCPKYIGGNFICRNTVELDLPKEVELKGNFYN